MAHDREERSKVGGIPLGPDPHAPLGQEQQRILGAPADWFGPVHPGLGRALRHPVKACRHWALRRRLGPFAPEEGDAELRG